MSLVFIAVFALGWQYPLLGYFIPFCMLLGIGISVFRGRKWCDWYCPRGSFYDFFGKAISRKKGIPALFKNMYFRLAVLMLLMAVMAVNLVSRWPDISRIGAFFVIMMTATTIIGLVLDVIFHQRGWCMLCPVGTIANLAGRNMYLLKINSELCAGCKACDKACPVEIMPSSYKSKGAQIINDADCLKCNLCILACPKNAIS